MSTPVFCCGFECRSAGHWSYWYTGVVQATYARNGGYANRMTVTATDTYVRLLASTASSTLVGRIYLYFVTLPSANVDSLVEVYGNDDSHYCFGYTSSTQKLNVGLTGASRTAGPTVAAGVWYRLDFKWVASANPHTLDWQVDGVAQTQFTNAVASTTWYAFDIGNPMVAATYDVAYDDVVLSHTAADYPWGSGIVKGYVPTSDGTHNVT